MKLKDMDSFDMERELSKRAPDDWEAREIYDGVRMDYEGTDSGEIYVFISEPDSSGEVEIDFTCEYNGYLYEKLRTVDTFGDLIKCVNKIFKIDSNTVDDIANEMVRTFKTGFDKLLK